ncbi:MAG: hypothetical protein ACXVB1_04195 [Pseudobdellovibrionaceae bacterium]
MNLEKLIDFSVTVVLAVALTGNLEKFTRFIQLQTLKLVYESRASNWDRPPMLGIGKSKTGVR